MAKKKKPKKADAGLMNSAGKFASRNRRALGLAGAGLAAAALFLGRRYRDQREAARWADNEMVGGAAI
jgi:hypothetical protein